MNEKLTFIALDVSLLPPPEPMTVILFNISKLAEKECLVIKHRRQPFPLYEKLHKAGFSYYCDVHTQDEITLYIFHQNAQVIFDEWLVGHNLSSALVKGGD